MGYIKNSLTALAITAGIGLGSYKMADSCYNKTCKEVENVKKEFSMLNERISLLHVIGNTKGIIPAQTEIRDVKTAIKKQHNLDLDVGYEVAYLDGLDAAYNPKNDPTGSSLEDKIKYMSSNVISKVSELGKIAEKSAWIGYGGAKGLFRVLGFGIVGCAGSLISLFYLGGSLHTRFRNGRRFNHCVEALKYYSERVHDCFTLEEGKNYFSIENGPVVKFFKTDKIDARGTKNANAVISHLTTASVSQGDGRFFNSNYSAEGSSMKKYIDLTKLKGLYLMKYSSKIIMTNSYDSEGYVNCRRIEDLSQELDKEMNEKKSVLENKLVSEYTPL